MEKVVRVKQGCLLDIVPLYALHVDVARAGSRRRRKRSSLPSVHGDG
jgi:hypothetical protein